MVPLLDILTYAILLGCEFLALCAMTRGGRGWIPRILGLILLVAVNVATESLWRFCEISPDAWLAVQFVACWLTLSGLTLLLSRDSFGRRLFLALCYGTYALGYASCFNVIVYRLFPVAADFRAPAGPLAVGLTVVALLNFVFVRWILPSLPRDGRNVRWGDSCFDAVVMFAAMFASSHWPVSLISAPVCDCVPFMLVSVAAWIVFPMVCGRMRDRQRAADIAHSLDLLMAEVKVRRAAIDLARRLRHDQRHHRAQIAEYMLAGQYERVFDYLKALDEEAQEAPTDKLVWCDNETVNAVLSGASRRATAQGVALDVTANVARTVGVPDVDLVALVANLLENAIEACGAKPVDAIVPIASQRSDLSASDAFEANASTGKTVTVALRQREHGLGLTVTNPVPRGFALSESGLPCAEPGVGLESVRRVVGRHGGQWSYELKDGMLKCRVILMFSNPDKS